MKRTLIAIAATTFLLALITGSLAQTESFTNFVSGAPVGLPTSTDIIPCIESNGANNVTRQCTPPSLFTLITGAQIETSLGYAPLNPANNLSDVSNSSTARTNLGVLAKASNLSDVASTSSARTNLGVLAIASNLSDVANTSTARTNLGVPFGLGTALLAANNLSDVSNTTTARANLGVLSIANNLSDVANATTTRNNIGLGTAAIRNTGTSGLTVPLLNQANTFSAIQTFTASLSSTATNVFVAPSNAIALQINGRSSDNVGGLFFYANNGVTEAAHLVGAASQLTLQATTGVISLVGGGVEQARALSGAGANFLTFAAGSSPTLSSGGGGININSATATTTFSDSSIKMPNILSSTAAQTGTLCWSATGITFDPSLGCLTSLEEFKTISGPIAEALPTVAKLEPFWFTPNTDVSQDLHEQPGFGAHQVASVDPRLVGYDAEGHIRGVRYMEMTALLAKAIQEQQAEIEQLKRQATSDETLWHHLKRVVWQ